MWTKIQKYLQGLSMKNSKGLATIVVIMGISVFCAVVGIASSRYLGPDNFIEQEAEQIIDKSIEYELHLPDGAVNIDLTPGSKKT